MSALNDLSKLARYKAWANGVLFDAVAQLPTQALVAPQPIVFGNLLRTLNHVLAMDRVWQAHLCGRAHGLTTRNPDECPPLARVRDAQNAIDLWYIDYADALAPRRREEVVRFEFIGGGSGAMSRADIVLHIVNHGTYHRGHVAGMMRAWLPPPITDYPVFLKTLSAG